MRILLCLLFMSISFSALAGDSNAGFFGFFGAIEIFFYDVMEFITVVIPTKITEFIFWFKLYMAYLKFYFILEALRFSHELALTFVQQLNISEVINIAISNLPNDLQKAASDMRVFDALSLIVEALITRFVYSVVTH